MSGALPSVRDLSSPAVCGRVFRPRLSGRAGAAERCGFSGRGKPAAAERGNMDSVPSEASQGLSERDFPRPAGKIAGERYFSGSRFPGRAVGLYFGVTACPREVTGDSPPVTRARPVRGLRAQGRPRRGNNPSLAGRASGCPRARGAGWDAPRRWGASSPAAWDFQRGWSRQQTPVLGLPEPQAAALPPCTVRGGRGLRAGSGGQSPTGRTCRPRADSGRAALAAGTGQSPVLRLIATLFPEGAELPAESHLRITLVLAPSE